MYDPKDEEPFSFLNALHERYFTDLTIRANTAKEVGLLPIYCDAVG